MSKIEIENMDNYETIHDGDFVSKNLDTVLSLIKEQQEMCEEYCPKETELKQLRKQIDLMAEHIHINDCYECPNIKCEEDR